MEYKHIEDYCFWRLLFIKSKKWCRSEDFVDISSGKEKWIGIRYFLGKKAKQNLKKKENPKIQQTTTPQPPKKPMGNKKAVILPKMPPMNNL